MRMKKIAFVFLFFQLLFASDLTLEIVKEVGSPKIAIEDCTTTVATKTDLKFFKLLVGDLEVSAHFNVDNRRNLANFDDALNLLKYKDKSYLLRYELYYNDKGALSARIKFFNVKNGTTILQKIYSITSFERYPFLAHSIIYDVNKALGFDDVGFLKSFVVFAQSIAPRKSNIVVSDYTLSYKKTIIEGGLNIFPKWANKEHTKLYYTAMQGVPTLYLVDIYKGTRKKILSSEGMLVCSDVSEDGSKLLLTMAPNYQPDIYEYDTITHRLRRITSYPGIDVNGNFVQQSKSVIFISDRLGYPTIFMKRIGSQAVQRVVYHGKNNSSCNAHNNYIVYTSRESDNAFGSNTFNIYLASLDSDYIRRLTANGVNLFPRFDEAGETVLYIKHHMRQTGLGIIRLKFNKAYIFPLFVGKIQSIDW